MAPALDLSVQGRRLDRSPDALGPLRRSDDAIDDALELRRRLADDGYLYLPGYLDRDRVLRARSDLLHRLCALGATAPAVDPEEAVPHPGFGRSFFPDVARGCQALMDLLYRGRVMALYERLLDGAVRHFDFTWFRAFPPGPGSKPHMDSVFMNRGTLELLSAWTPIGDIDPQLGGVAILEGSHRCEEIRRGYGRRDVDVYCANEEGAATAASHDGILWDGALADDASQLRRDIGGRWLTTAYRAGDLLTFTIFTVHCGLDNNADRLRLSCDSRYQPAGQPADPRWVGVDPSAHGRRSKRGTIC